MNINVLKLWPVIAAARRWGPVWRDANVRLRTDNTQVQFMINTSKGSSLFYMWWLRKLLWLSFIYNFLGG